ncbi:MAG: hypothetical protein ABIE92_03735, partial [bacterium]
MRNLLTLLLCLMPVISSAQWPTTVEEDLPVSTDPHVITRYPQSFPFTDNSTIVILTEYGGPRYQIIDKYGQLTFPSAQSLFPAITTPAAGQHKSFLDGEGGVIVTWWNVNWPDSAAGIRAQQIDSLGNICWGDSAWLIDPRSEPQYGVCLDGNGGLYAAISGESLWGYGNDIWIQHINSEGQKCWGDSGIWILGSE